MIKFNLRLKLIVGFVLFLITSIGINILLHKDFEYFQKNVDMLIDASNVSNICLEIRRYEKNYIINRDRTFYKKAEEYIDKLYEYLPGMEKHIDPYHADIFRELKGKIERYKIEFVKLGKVCGAEQQGEKCVALTSIQPLGADIVALAEEMVTVSQRVITSFLKQSKVKLVFYYMFLAAFSLLGVVIYYVRVANRLKSLEVAANSIARGEFVTAPVSTIHDEVQVVFQAFNRMVVELEQRQDKLFQAEKLSSIGTLASGIAHQLNNPLNNIATSCQLVLEETKEGVAPAFLEKMLRIMDEETQRAAEIVRGLLEFSRQELFACKLVDLSELARKAVDLVRSELPAGIVILQDIPAHLTACLDEQKMKEVLLNLMINAIHAIPESPGTITIAAEEDMDADTVVITVTDTGTGIDEADRSKIFDPFYTTKAVGHGTGLGLAVVYGIIKQHKGTISVCTNQPRGTTFILTLPHFLNIPAQSSVSL